MSETQTAPAIDKSTWGPGEWQDEPDRVDFVRAGFACFVRRHPAHGYLCGYVGVPPEHPLHGRAYADLDFEVHGGVTYAAACDGADICHVPEPGMPDNVWWFGFDTGHCFDYAPALRARMSELANVTRERGAPWASAFELTALDRMEQYRALPYVRGETESLADQLADYWAARATP